MGNIKGLEKHFRIDLRILIKGKKVRKKKKTNPNNNKENTKTQISLHPFLPTASSSMSWEMGPSPSTHPSISSSLSHHWQEHWYLGRTRGTGLISSSSALPARGSGRQQ